MKQERLSHSVRYPQRQALRFRKVVEWDKETYDAMVSGTLFICFIGMTVGNIICPSREGTLTILGIGLTFVILFSAIVFANRKVYWVKE